MDDLISRQAAIEALGEKPLAWTEGEYELGLQNQWQSDVDALNGLPSAQPDCSFEIQDILDYLDTVLHPIISPEHWNVYSELHDMISTLPSAQPEQRYTKKELEIFKHGISLSLLSKRSSQHWHYDEDTATEIEFLERLYEKVVADMREGEEDE